VLRLLRNLNSKAGLPKSRWQRSNTGGRKTAVVACPKCGKISSLAGHEIDEIGRVTPSLMCPHDKCEFHDFVQLIGWSRT